MPIGGLLVKIHWLLFGLFFVDILSGCGHVVQDNIKPATFSKYPYTYISSAIKENESQWWKVFNDPLLDGYIEKALVNNFTIKEGFARLKQAHSFQNQADIYLYPTLDGRINAGAEWDEENNKNTSNTIQLGLAWEVDLWGRLSSAAEAVSHETLAVEDGLQGVIQLISTEVAETYFQLVVQNLYLQLLQRQIEANTTSLKIIKLRFANGAASLVDVYQQKQILAGVKTEIPLSEAATIILQNRLRVLLGQTPSSVSFLLQQNFPEIPPLPLLGIPADLLQNRPDLRQLQRELVAADYRVAEAVANRLPSLRIGGSVAIISGDFITSLFADALASIVDWGAKKSEVDKKKAIVEEKAARYSQRYLLAIEEVENALWQERKHDQLLIALEEQLLIAKATLRESRGRYIQGVTDYLPVLTALMAFQNLEMSILRRQGERLSYRLLLYRALGGQVVRTNNSNVLTIEPLIIQ